MVLPAIAWQLLVVTFKVKISALLLAVALLVGGYLYFFYDWSAHAVRAQFENLVQLVEKEGAVSSFEALGRSRQFAEVFMPDAFVEYYPGRSLPRNLKNLGAAYLTVWNRLESASVRVARHDVEVDASKEEAVSQLLATCSVILEGSERMGDTVEYKIYWTKFDGEWRIERLVSMGQR